MDNLINKTENHENGVESTEPSAFEKMANEILAQSENASVEDDENKKSDVESDDIEEGSDSQANRLNDEQDRIENSSDGLEDDPKDTEDNSAEEKENEKSREEIRPFKSLGDKTLLALSNTEKIHEIDLKYVTEEIERRKNEDNFHPESQETPIKDDFTENGFFFGSGSPTYREDGTVSRYSSLGTKGRIMVPTKNALNEEYRNELSDNLTKYSVLYETQDETAIWNMIRKNNIEETGSYRFSRGKEDVKNFIEDLKQFDKYWRSKGQFEHLYRTSLSGNDKDADPWIEIYKFSWKEDYYGLWGLVNLHLKHLEKEAPKDDITDEEKASGLESFLGTNIEISKEKSEELLETINEFNIPEEKRKKLLILAFSKKNFLSKDDEQQEREEIDEKFNLSEYVMKEVLSMIGNNKSDKDDRWHIIDGFLIDKKSSKKKYPLDLCKKLIKKNSEQILQILDGEHFNNAFNKKISEEREKFGEKGFRDVSEFKVEQDSIFFDVEMSADEFLSREKKNDNIIPCLLKVEYLDDEDKEKIESFNKKEHLKFDMKQELIKRLQNCTKKIEVLAHYLDRYGRLQDYYKEEDAPALDNLDWAGIIERQKELGIDSSDSQISACIFDAFLTTIYLLRNGPISKQAENLFKYFGNPEEFEIRLKQIYETTMDKGLKARITRFKNNSPAFFKYQKELEKNNYLNDIINREKNNLPNGLTISTFNDLKTIIELRKKREIAEHAKNNPANIQSLPASQIAMNQQLGNVSKYHKGFDFDFGDRKVESLLNLGKFIELNNPSAGVEYLSGTFDGENKNATTLEDRYKHANLNDPRTYLGFMFTYDNHRCVFIESFGKNAAAYLYRADPGENPLAFFNNSKVDNYSNNPKCARINHLNPDLIDESIDDVQKKALRFFTVGIKSVVNYNSAGNRERWERAFEQYYPGYPMASYDESGIIDPDELTRYEKWQAEQDAAQNNP